jgi:hypothetical protein
MVLALRQASHYFAKCHVQITNLLGATGFVGDSGEYTEPELTIIAIDFILRCLLF